MMDDHDAQGRFRQDLDAMQALVREGLTYARTLHGTIEPALRVDADALLESLVADYADAGEQVQLEGRVGEAIVTRPHALRRILVNLIDNGLKFGSDVRLHAERAGEHVVLSVLDRGPGIPPEYLDAVLKPFYRVESSRSTSAWTPGPRASPRHAGRRCGMTAMRRWVTGCKSSRIGIRIGIWRRNPHPTTR